MCAAVFLSVLIGGSPPDLWQRPGLFVPCAGGADRAVLCADSEQRRRVAAFAEEPARPAAAEVPFLRLAGEPPPAADVSMADSGAGRPPQPRPVAAAAAPAPPAADDFVMVELVGGVRLRTYRHGSAFVSPYSPPGGGGGGKGRCQGLKA